MSELKKTFLKLLEEDLEFRYAIAGLIGLREVLNRLDKVEEEIKKLWEEVKELRIGQNKLWEEVRSLREGQEKLWENQNKLWEEVKALREGQNKLWEEVRSLREEQTKIWGEIKGLKAEVTSFGRAVGRTLEDYTSAFIEVFLEDKGYSREEIKVGKGIFIYDGEIVEVDVFNEKPLIVGEVTTYLRDKEEAEKEVEKLLKHIEVAQKKFKRDVEFKFLSVGNAPEKVIEFLKETAKMRGIKLIYGKSLIEESY
ncbi:MAG: hypothetical protein QXG49_02145 [Candidatus Bathyarchaeia archaeon]